jgi:type I restriction enzyme S subunit
MSFEQALLGESSLQIIDGDRGTNYPKQNEFAQNGYCLFLSAKNVTSNGFEFSEMSFITQEKDSMLRKGKLQRNDVVLTTRGTVGNVAFYSSRVRYSNIRINSGMVIIRTNDNEFIPSFVYWLFRSPLIQNQIKSIQTGSAQPQLPITIMRNLSLVRPSIRIQNTITNILFVLDDKIELNNRMNKILEQMAQALYKQWFVDFEFPNESGEPYKSSGGEMEWCEELGKEIPSGWRFSKLSELIESVSKTYKFINDEVIFLNTSDILDGEILESNYSKVSSLPGQAKKSILKNDILYSEIRPANKRFAYIDFDSNDYVVSTKLMVLRAKSYVDPVLIFYYLTNQEVIDYLQMVAESRSGTFPQITFQSFDSLNLVIGPEQIMCQLAEGLKSIFEKVRSNKKQNNKLSNLRDTLIPKLMSGEIDVSQIEF